MSMTRTAARWAAITLAALACGPALGQVQPTPGADPLADPDAVLVEELVVVAREKGPPWWRVSDGDTTVYVLGAPDVAPKGLAWDHSALLRRLKDANVVILPFNRLGVGVLQAPGAAIAYLREKGPPIETRLPEPLRSRFVAVREKLGQPAKRYGWDSELAAAMVLVADYRDRARLTNSDPGKTVAWFAKTHRLKTLTKSYPAGPLIGAARRTPANLQRLCLEAVLDSVEAGPGAIRAGGAAWAEGDPRPSLAIARPYDRCVNAVPAGRQLTERLKADTAQAITRALGQPGHAVAVVHMGPLLSEGGVLERLRARGFTVKTPGDA